MSATLRCKLRWFSESIRAWRDPPKEPAAVIRPALAILSISDCRLASAICGFNAPIIYGFMYCEAAEASKVPGVKAPIWSVGMFKLPTP